MRIKTILKARFLILWCLIFIIPFSAKAQLPELKIEHINMDEGLSNPNIRAIFKDYQGFLWVATSNGICRYDGYSFKVYKYDPKDSSSLNSNAGGCFFEDNSHNLWIGNDGLHKYIRETDNFERFKNNPKDTTSIDDNGILCIYQNKKGTIWIGTNLGLNKFDETKKTFKRFKPYDDYNLGGLHGRTCYSIMEDNGGGMWVLLHEKGGLTKFDLQTESFRQYLPYPNDTSDILNYTGYQIFKDHAGLFWISKYNGLHLFDPVKGIYLQKWDNRTNKDVLRINNVNSVCEDQSNNIWVATVRGLNIIKNNDRKVFFYQNAPVKQDALNLTNVSAMYRDNTGIIWLGTSDAGLIKYDPNQFKFEDKIPQINNCPVPTNQSIKSINQVSNGNYLIGTDYGLNICDSAFNILKTYKTIPNDKSSIGIGGVIATLEDNDGNYWLGLWGGGLIKYSRRTGIFSNFKICPTDQFNSDCTIYNCLMSLALDADEILWIGSMNGYLEELNTKTKHISHHYLGDNFWVYQLIIDNDKDLIWAITSGGLFKYFKNSGLFRRYCAENSGISTNDCTSFVKDKNGNFWIGALNGLIYFDVQKETFKVYTTRDGLENDYILTVQIDNSGNVWAGTDNSIVKFDLQQHVFHNYTKQEGVKENAGYSYKNKKGILFFGGANGLNIFDPRDIKNNENSFNVALTGFKLFNKLVVPYKKSVLPQTINTIEEIVLKHHQSVITLEYAALNYTLTKKNKYAFRLDGFDKEWQHVGHQRSVTYTNLEPGEYTFRVKACNSDGFWCQQEKALKIIITPPFWKTIGFKLLFAIFIMATIYIWFNIRTRSLKNNQIRLEKLVRDRTHDISLQKDKILMMSETMHEMDQKQIKFLINLAHEFRTPLTLILSPVEKLMSGGQNVSNPSFYYKIIYNNAQRMLRLVNQLLIIRKIESNNFNIKVKEGDIISFLRFIFDNYLSLAQKNQISYTFESGFEQYSAWFDPDVLDKIIQNFISNAFKYTQDKGSICLKIEEVDDIPAGTHKMAGQKVGTNTISNRKIIAISVIDSGIGIAPDKIDRVFDRFYQIENSSIRSADGTGLGLNLALELAELHHAAIKVESELNTGSRFTLCIPVEKENYKNEEINTEDSSNSLKFKPKELSWHDYSLKPVGQDDEVVKESSPCVLFVDDNEELRLFIRNELPQFNLVLAENGNIGVEKAIELVPDLIITDVMMPQMDGFEMCRIIKSDQRTNHIPVLMLTAKNEYESNLQGLELGADDFISKPFQIELLVLKINNLLQTRLKFNEFIRKQFLYNPKPLEVKSASEAFVERCINIVEKYIADRNFNADIFCKEVGVSKSQLYKKINAITGQSINEFFQSVRLRRAAQLLLSKQLTVSEVAFQVGFNDPKYFSRCFREQYKKSPTDYMNINT